VLLNTATGGGIGVEVSDLSEEVGTETLMGVVEDSVLVVVSSGGGVLGEELNLPDEVSLATLGGGSLLGLLVERLDEFLNIGGLNSGDSE